MLAVSCSSSPPEIKESRLKPEASVVEPKTAFVEDKFFAPEKKPSGKTSLFDSADQNKNSKNKTLETIERSKEPKNVSGLRKPGARRQFFLPTQLNPKDKSVMVLIYKGDYLVGTPGARGLQKKTIPAFYIDQYEITAAKYKIHKPGYSEKPFNGSEACPACPAMGIDWESASRYCRWAGKRLPSESEWEAAARGAANHHWPWGDNWLPKYANTLEKEDGFDRAAPVGSFPLGASPFGALDMTGNVWEWVSAEDPPANGNAAMNPDSKKPLHAAKGGSWKSAPKSSKISFRHMVKPGFKNDTFGFRCAKSIKSKTK